MFPNEDSTERIFIEDDTLYEHPILNIKYTSYEVAQERDTVHVGYNRTGVMVHTPVFGEDENELWSYASVLAVYHVTVRTASNTKPNTLTILWVRWMQRNTDRLTGPNSRNYTRVSFVPWSGTIGSTFDFVDPSHVVRACHLIPTFNLGRTCDLLDPSIARDPKGDWCAYYPNRYDLDRSRPRLANLVLIMTHGPTSQLCRSGCLREVCQDWNWMSTPSSHSRS